MRISFVNTTAEPVFTPTNVWATSFTENVEGREEFQIIPEATDPKNLDVIIESEKIPIFYFIDGSFKTKFNQDKLIQICEIFQKRIVQKTPNSLNLTKQAVGYRWLKI